MGVSLQLSFMAWSSVEKRWMGVLSFMAWSSVKKRWMMTYQTLAPRELYMNGRNKTGIIYWELWISLVWFLMLRSRIQDRRLGTSFGLRRRRSPLVKLSRFSLDWCARHRNSKSSGPDVILKCHLSLIFLLNFSVAYSSNFWKIYNSRSASICRTIAGVPKSTIFSPRCYWEIQTSEHIDSKAKVSLALGWSLFTSSPCHVQAH